MEQATLRQLASRIVKGAVRQVAATVRLEIRIRRHDWTDVASFIPFRDTLRAAKDAGLSVGDYIDGVMNGIPGATQATITQVAALGAISDRTRHVVEIGPGSGRYLEKVLKLCAPESYHIYETAGDWADYVASTYGVTRCPTNGCKLGTTKTDSVDLIQAYKVLSATTLLTTARYWLEMTRVTRVGGYAVFDIVTEDSLGPETVERWALSDLETGTYPAAIPRRVALDFFASKGFQLAGSFFVPMGVGTTETFVFNRTTRTCDRAAAA
jgi:hypothetical protein